MKWFEELSTEEKLDEIIEMSISYGIDRNEERRAEMLKMRDIFLDDLVEKSCDEK